MSNELRKEIENIVALTDEEFEWVAAHFQERRFRKHQIIIHEGDYVKYDFYVAGGLMKSSHISPGGKEHIIQFATEDCWITDPQAFHSGTQATMTVECLEDTRVFAITLENREKLCSELQKMEYFFRKKATAGYITLQKRIQCFISSNAAHRYHSLLTQHPGLISRVSKSMIASYLGITRETLSRLTAV